MGVMTPGPPGEEQLALDTPAVAVAKRNLHLDVRGDDSPHEQIGLHCPVLTVIDIYLWIRHRQIDDGIADDDGVGTHRHRYLGHHSRAGAAQGLQIFL